MENENKVAFLVYFADHVTEERAVAWLNKLKEQGHVTGITGGEYDPNRGEPVWYIP